MAKVLQVMGFIVVLLGYAYANECVNEGDNYADETRCDTYYKCDANLVAVMQVCPNGLVYNVDARPNEYPCIYLSKADCGLRKLPRPKNSSLECDYDYEVKGVGYPSQCNKYRNCAMGVATELSCPENLAYSEEKEACEWSDLVEECDANAFTGFKCPENASNNQYFESPVDCKHYFICLDGRPRWMICHEETYFDPCASTCVAPTDLKCGACKDKFS